jgi:hypothetical protein
MKFLPTSSSLPPCSRPSRGFRGINGCLPTPGGKASVMPTKAASAPGAGPLHLFHDPLDGRCAWRCSEAVGTKGVPTPALRAGSTRLRRVEQRAGLRKEGRGGKRREEKPKGAVRCSGAQSKCGGRAIKGHFRRTIRENIGGRRRTLCETERALRLAAECQAIAKQGE